MNNLEQLRDSVMNEPFLWKGRDPARLVFDFGILISMLKRHEQNKNVLDFGAGSCWISEWLNRLGFNVTAFDFPGVEYFERRADLDKRVDRSGFNVKGGDGHELPFEGGFFSNVCCFDALHHMHDYRKVLGEFHRVLVPGGRAVFVEPGAKHSTSEATVEFMKKVNDPRWIERDVVLPEIHGIARETGFRAMRVIPTLLPGQLSYSFGQWMAFRKVFSLGAWALRLNYLRRLTTMNYDNRITFYLEK